jgi:hypothetical protein
MAGDWIKFETATSDKPEVWAMAQSLGIDADAVVGKLLRVWAWFDQQTQEGNAVGNGASVTSSVTKALLDRRVGVSGFCESMILSGWMADDGQSLTLPNFDRHNGKTAKTRAMTAKRVATHKAKSNGASVTSSVSSALPREEKRREEDKVAKATSVPRPANADPGPLADHGFTLSNGNLWRPTVAKIHEWQATFPVMDLDAQLRLAGQWLKDNPAKRKTERGMHRFLFAWLERAQNSNKALPLFQPNQAPKRPDPYADCPRYS